MVLTKDDREITSPGWYAVTEDVTFSSRMFIDADVNLIVCDGATLTASVGIGVREHAKLTIRAQSTGDTMGTVKAITQHVPRSLFALIP